MTRRNMTMIHGTRQGSAQIEQHQQYEEESKSEQKFVIDYGNGYDGIDDVGCNNNDDDDDSDDVEALYRHGNHDIGYRTISCSTVRTNNQQRNNGENPLEQALHMTEIHINIMSFCDLPTLVTIRTVSHKWKEQVEKIFASWPKKSLMTKWKLKDAVHQYCDGNLSTKIKVRKLYGIKIGNWDVSQVTDFSWVFYNNHQFNEPLDGWDVSNAKLMDYMFCQAKSFNQDIGTWDTSKVKGMSAMFNGAKLFNQDIGTWDTSKVKDMSYMFYGVPSFNQDIGTWNTGQVSYMSYMFCGAQSFNQDISNWDTSNVWTMSHMFHRAHSFNQPIGKWHVKPLGFKNGCIAEGIFCNSGMSFFRKTHFFVKHFRFLIPFYLLLALPLVAFTAIFIWVCVMGIVDPSGLKTEETEGT